MTAPATRQRKRAFEIAQAIESEIRTLGWPVGRSLGSEPALINRYEVSRAVMREAIRIVESHGVAQMRLGPGGGLTVTAPSPEVALASVSLLLDHAEVSARDLFEARNAVELSCVALAAERIDEGGIARLRAALEDEGRADLDQPAPGDPRRLHLAIASETGNAALVLMVDILTRLIAERADGVRSMAHEAGEAQRAHAAIVAAIVAGDGALAQHRMRRHLATAISARYGADEPVPDRAG